MKTRMKNVKKIFSYVKNKLNDEKLVVSLADDSNDLMLSIAVHKSEKYQYDGIVQIKSVKITQDSMGRYVYEILDQAVDYFKDQLKPINII